MAVTGYDLPARIAEALTLGTPTGVTALPLYGESIEVEEIALDETEPTDIKVYVSVNNRLVDDVLTASSGGEVQSGDLWLWLFSLSAYEAVKQTNELFRSIGYETECEAVGLPGKKFDIGNLTVFKFKPVGGLNTSAQQYGNVYVVRQLIDFQVIVNNN